MLIKTMFWMRIMKILAIALHFDSSEVKQSAKNWKNV